MNPVMNFRLVQIKDNLFPDAMQKKARKNLLLVQSLLKKKKSRYSLASEPIRCGLATSEQAVSWVPCQSRHLAGIRPSHTSPPGLAPSGRAAPGPAWAAIVRCAPLPWQRGTLQKSIPDSGASYVTTTLRCIIWVLRVVRIWWILDIKYLKKYFVYWNLAFAVHIQYPWT